MWCHISIALPSLSNCFSCLSCDESRRKYLCEMTDRSMIPPFIRAVTPHSIPSHTRPFHNLVSLGRLNFLLRNAKCCRNQKLNCCQKTGPRLLLWRILPGTEEIAQSHDEPTASRPHWRLRRRRRWGHKQPQHSFTTQNIHQLKHTCIWGNKSVLPILSGRSSCEEVEKMWLALLAKQTVKLAVRLNVFEMTELVDGLRSFKFDQMLSMEIWVIGAISPVLWCVKTVWKVAVQALLKQVTFTVRKREDQLGASAWACTVNGQWRHSAGAWTRSLRSSWFCPKIQEGFFLWWEVTTQLLKVPVLWY